MKCSDERKEYLRQYRLKNNERIKARLKKYYLENKEKFAERSSEYNKANREKIQKKNREFRAKNKEALSAYATKYRQDYPKVIKAKNIVTYAVKTGKISKPVNCEFCEKERATEGHHDDYNKPLELWWLCRPCHRLIHASLGEGRNKQQ